MLQLPDLADEPAADRLHGDGEARGRPRVLCALADSDWHSLWNRRRTAVHAGALLLGLLVPAACAWMAPEAARLSVARWLWARTSVGRSGPI